MQNFIDVYQYSYYQYSKQGCLVVAVYKRILV